MLTERSSATVPSQEFQDALADRADVVRGSGARLFGVVARDRLEDAAVCVDGGVCTLVRLEPVLARGAQHVPDDGEHRREQLVLRGTPDRLVKPRVLFGVGLAGPNLALLR